MAVSDLTRLEDDVSMSFELEVARYATRVLRDKLSRQRTIRLQGLFQAGAGRDPIQDICQRLGFFF